MTYEGSANYTIGLSGTVWPLHMGAGLYGLGRALRYMRSKQKKLRENGIFSQGAWPTALKFLGSVQHLWLLISRPGLFGVRIQQTELFRRNGLNHAHFSKSKCIDELAHLIKLQVLLTNQSTSHYLSLALLFVFWLRQKYNIFFPAFPLAMSHLIFSRNSIFLLKFSRRRKPASRLTWAA